MRKNSNSNILPLWRTSSVNKQRFSVMAKGSDYFLLLDDKSKLRYKVKINYMINTKNFQAILVNFYQCSDIIACYS